MASSTSRTIQRLTETLWDRAFDSLDPDLKATLAQIKSHRRDILAAVSEKATEKRDLCLQKRWKFKKPTGDVVILRDILEKIVTWVARFKEVVDTAVQFDPSHAALPWAAVRFLLQASCNDVELFGAIVTDLETISRLVTRYKEFELRYVAGQSLVRGMLEESLTSLYTEVLRYLGRMVHYFSDRTIGKVCETISVG